MRHVFTPGTQVLLKAKLPWKLKCRGTGPYTFEEYCGRKGTNAIIVAEGGKRYHVSSANLVPILAVPAAGTRLARFSPSATAAHGPEESSGTVTWPSSSRDPSSRDYNVVNNESGPP